MLTTFFHQEIGIFIQYKIRVMIEYRKYVNLPLTKHNRFQVIIDSGKVLNLPVKKNPIIITVMNNHALKLVKEKGSVSLKTNDLIKKYEIFSDDLHDYDFYEKARYYHKQQRGILRISKYEFFPSKEHCTRALKKNPIEISEADSFYDYPEAENNSAVWHLNFADDVAFGSVRTTPGSQEDILLKEMPLLYNASRCISEDCYSCIIPTTCYKDGGFTIPTPVLFENVPQWNEVKNSAVIKTITRDKKNNIISMKAPNVLKKNYSAGNMGFLCYTLFAGLGGICKQTAKSKITEIEFHTGNWGCGNLHNNRELIYLSQMCVASIMGFKKIVFHKPEEVSFVTAREKFFSMPEKMSYDELVKYLLSQGYEKNTEEPD